MVVEIASVHEILHVIPEEKAENDAEKEPEQQKENEPAKPECPIKRQGTTLANTGGQQGEKLHAEQRIERIENELSKPDGIAAGVSPEGRVFPQQDKDQQDKVQE